MDTLANAQDKRRDLCFGKKEKKNIRDEVNLES